MRGILGLAVLLSGCQEYTLSAAAPLPGSVFDPTQEQLSDGPNSGRQSDSWHLDETRKSDILFFGDTSGSMHSELDSLADHVNTFVDRLSTYSRDWQILVVTGPDGCALDGILTEDTPDFADVFGEAITTAPGEDLVDEWGLYNAQVAIDSTDPGECNDGFVRDDAVLHIVFVSDEDDNSPGYDDGDPDYWRSYVDAIAEKKDRDDRIIYSAVTGPVPNGCDGADPGFGYADAVEESSGRLLSICDPWEDELASLADISVARWDFTLSQAPLPPSIEVWIDQTQRADGTWSFDTENNQLHFHVDPPVTGNDVLITYETLR